MAGDAMPGDTGIRQAVPVMDFLRMAMCRQQCAEEVDAMEADATKLPDAATRCPSKERTALTVRVTRVDVTRARVTSGRGLCPQWESVGV